MGTFNSTDRLYIDTTRLCDVKVMWLPQRKPAWITAPLAAVKWCEKIWPSLHHSATCWCAIVFRVQEAYLQICIIGSFHTSLVKQTWADLFSDSESKNKPQLIVRHDKELCTLHECVCACSIAIILHNIDVFLHHIFDKQEGARPIGVPPKKWAD